jgi:ubiquinone/menaquinone biosynthesis C-methylase UbiE
MPTELPRDENTYILDSESATEMARLISQDRLITQGMGSLFPEQLDISNFHTILDIACGPGGWVCDVAFANPDTQVTGIDISNKMIEYARAMAWSQRLENTSFQVMDVLKPLDFPDNSFDLVNARFLVAFMPKQVQPFMVKMKVATPEEIEQSYQQMLLEMRSENFCALWYYLTTWGQKPR